MSRPIVIDTDPGIDDAFAIALALASPELDVRALTTIFGNAATETTTHNALVILEASGRADVPVAAGEARPIATEYLGPVPQVHGANGLGGTRQHPVAGSVRDVDAAEMMYSIARQRPGEVTLVALGPLTNLAVALQRHPDLIELVHDVVVMGGNALVPGNATPTAEANINNDPEAADLVFGARWPVTMVGLDVTHKINLTGAAIDRITSTNSRGMRLLAEALPLYRRFFEHTNKIDGIFVHDPSVIAYLLEPSLFKTEAWPIRVETESFSRGKTWPNLGNTDEATPAAWRRRPPVTVCTEANSAGVIDLLERRLRAGP